MQATETDYLNRLRRQASVIRAAQVGSLQAQIPEPDVPVQQTGKSGGDQAPGREAGGM